MTNLEKYLKDQELLKIYRYADFIISYDEETVCPKKDKKTSLEVSSYFVKKIIEITTSDEYFNILESLTKDDSLDNLLKQKINREYKDLLKQRRIPKELIYEEVDLIDSASLSWEEARDTLNFNDFINDLNLLVGVETKKANYLAEKLEGYDVILDDMEESFTSKEYDELFDLIEKEILPLVKKILAAPKKYNEKIKDIKFDIDKQKKLTRLICDLMGYDDTVGCVGETIHPFTNGINCNDVRTTTRYEEKLLFSNLFSVMHEVGHATYELQNDPRFSESALMGGASCAMHESQSRFYENYLGRSKAFIKYLYPILKDLFKEELKDYTFDDIYYYVNDVSNQPIRTEADELTYPFHIIIRYKIEKMLFSGEIKAEDVEKTFNDLMKKYLNSTPNNLKEGAFQDVHWTGGFGYFPTYALGSAMSAQFYHYMKKDLDIDALMEKGDFKPINNWLKEHVHKYGRSKSQLEVLKLATGEDFNPNYYIDYLKDKFKKIYNI